MKASMFHKGAAPGQPRGGGSPLHAAPTAAAAPAGAAGAAGASVEEDEVSEYTDADESISAPTEFLAEFLSAIMGKDYPTALKYCKLILQYEPNNRTAREFYPLIVEKLVQSTIDEARTDSEEEEDEDEEDSEDSSSSSGGSGSLSSSDSSDLSDEEDDGEEEEGEEEEGGRRRRRRRQHNDNSSVEFGDTDGTTASYSSLEDEEVEPTRATAGLNLNYNDNADAGNGNEVPAGSKVTRCSDSESPTEPVSQQLIGELRSRVVPEHLGNTFKSSSVV